MRSLKVTMAAVLLVSMVVAAPVASAAPRQPTSDAPTVASTDQAYALVQLALDPLSVASASKPEKGSRIDFNRSTTKNYRSQLSAQRNQFKQWLRTNLPKANVTGEYDIALNAVSVQLNGHTLDQLRRSPLVTRAEYERIYHPLADDPDLALIDAVNAWNSGGGPAGAGRGVKVAVIDTGIDVTHTCFADAGYPAVTQLGDRRFTNNKVIAAKVFNMRAKNQGYTAAAVQDHGTHVAGTVACNHLTPATVNGVAIPYAMSGVAPAALLGNYNVFPADVEDARSEDIMNALQAAYADGFDVANMSLGGGAHGAQDLLTVAVDNLDRANMVGPFRPATTVPGTARSDRPAPPPGH